MNQQKKARKVGRPRLPRGRAKSQIVPVRVNLRRLKKMHLAAKESNKTLSTWIRNALKKALKEEGVMTTHEDQVESGKRIVRETLEKLANELRESQVKDLKFTVTDQDFDRDETSLIAPKGHVVVKINNDDLSDCQADPTVCSRLESQIREAVYAFYKPNSR